MSPSNQTQEEGWHQCTSKQYITSKPTNVLYLSVSHSLNDTQDSNTAKPKTATCGSALTDLYRECCSTEIDCKISVLSGTREAGRFGEVAA